MKIKIVYPIIELTDYVFEKEKVFNAELAWEWDFENEISEEEYLKIKE